MMPRFDPRIVAAFLVAAFITGALALAERNAANNDSRPTGPGLDTSDSRTGEKSSGGNSSGDKSSGATRSRDTGSRDVAASDEPGDAPPPRAESDRNVPGDFDYFTLVLSWSPTHCATEEGERDTLQCSPPEKGRHYGFVLHGLWPQYETGYPEACRIGQRPFVPDDVIAGVLDVMPSKGLVIHEYRTHGTCSGLEPGDYFDTARRLFGRIQIPRRFLNTQETRTIAPGDVVDEFVTANEGLEPDMVAVNCVGSDNRLEDVRICFTKDGSFRACGSNEDQDRLCRARTIRMPPVRSTR